MYSEWVKIDSPKRALVRRPKGKEARDASDIGGVTNMSWNKAAAKGGEFDDCYSHSENNFERP
jgi:hypothetical protein